MNQRMLAMLGWGMATIFLLAGCRPISAEVDAPVVDAPTEEQITADASLYQDPNGMFTVPIPPNWLVDEQEGYATLTDPDQQIQMYVLALPGTEIEPVIAAAWALVDPTFDLEPTDVQNQGAGGGIEQEVFITYDDIAASGRLALAGARLYEGNVYLTLLDAELGALERRASQVNTVLTGLTIAGLEQVNLATVDPLPFDAARQAEFEAYIEVAMERFMVPGAAVAVVQDGEVVYLRGFGVQELGTDTPVTPTTQMMIGSSTKTFTTFLMATLVDKGLFDWNTPVVEILPDFQLADPTLTNQITVRNLVCNCTGVSRRDIELLFNSQDLSAEDIVASLATFEVFTDFGESFQYSNQMIATGGYAAGAASHADMSAPGDMDDLYTAYRQAMQTHVFDPLGMSNTTLDMPTPDIDYATPHGLDLSFTYAPISLDQERFVDPVAPAGAIWSTAEDMGRYLITQLNQGITPDGTQAVSAENLLTTWEPQVAVSADTAYGLGWFVADYKGQPLLHHGGNTIGFTSDLAFLPEAGIGISILTNARASSLNQAVRYRLLELLFEQPHEYDERATLSFDAFRNEYARISGGLTQVDEEQVQPYLGEYSNPALGQVTLMLRDDTLIMDVGEFETELWPQMDADGALTSTYITDKAPGLTGIPVRLDVDTDGNPVLIYGMGTFEYTFEMVE